MSSTYTDTYICKAAYLYWYSSKVKIFVYSYSAKYKLLYSLLYNNHFHNRECQCSKYVYMIGYNNDMYVQRADPD